MPTFRRVLLYVGAPKTGTTSIQGFIWTNRAALIKQGFFVPKTGRRGAQHMDLPATLDVPRRNSGLDRHADINAGNLQARRGAFLAGLDEELSQAPACHTLLLMSEYMFSSSRRELRAYRDFSARYAPRMESIMYLRRQDRWLASLVLQARKSGSRIDFGLNPGSPENYAGNILAWEGNSRVCDIRRFEREFLFKGDLIEDFCKTVGIDATGLGTEEIRANPAIYQEQIELMDALNAKLESMAFGRRIPYRRGFIPFCAEALGGTRIAFSRGAAKAAFEAYADINIWLRDNFDPDGPDYFFNDDFSDYEENPMNDACYSLDQLARLAGVMRRQSRRLDIPGRPRPNPHARQDLIDFIVSAYLPLRDAQLRRDRRAKSATRKAAEEALFSAPD